MSNIYLVMENKYDIPTWGDKSKAFLERNHAIRYFHELMTSPEVRGMMVSPTRININNTYENELFTIKETWLEYG